MNISQVVLLVALTTTGMSQSFVFAVLPPLGREIGLSDVQISSIATVAAIFFVLSAPILGNLSERHGRVKFIRLGLFAATLTNLVYAVAIRAGLDGIAGSETVYVLLVGSRIALNICWGGMFPAVQAYVVDTTPADRRSGVLALVATASGIGTIVGPTLAWVLIPFGATTPFLAVAGCSFAALTATFFVLQEPAVAQLRQMGERKPPDMLGVLVSVGPYLFVGFVNVFSSALIQQLTAFRLQDLFGLTAQEATRQTGFALTALAVAMVIAQTVVARYGPYWNPWSLLRTGCCFATVGIGGFAAAGFAAGDLAYVLQVTALAAVGFGLGFIVPGNTAAFTLCAGSDNQARAAGLLNAAQGLGMMSGPVIGTLLYQLNSTAPFLLAAVLMSFALTTAFAAQAHDYRKA